MYASRSLPIIDLDGIMTTYGLARLVERATRGWVGGGGGSLDILFPMSASFKELDVKELSPSKLFFTLSIDDDYR